MARSPHPILNIADSSTLDLTLTGAGTRQAPWQLTARLLVDPDPANLLEFGTAGAFVGAPAIGVIDDDKIDLTLTGSGTVADPFVISGEIRTGGIGTTELADGAVTAVKLAGTVGLNDLGGAKVDGPIDANNQPIGNLPAPVTGDQAATKAYVDAAVAAVPAAVTGIADTPTVDLVLTGTILSGQVVDGSITVAKLDPDVNLTDLDGPRIVGPVDLNGQRVVNLADPVLAQDAATKAYVDRNMWFRAPSNSSWIARRDTHVVVGANVTVTLPADGGGFWMIEDPTTSWGSGTTPDVIAPAGTTVGSDQVTLRADGGGPIMWVLIGTEWWPIQNAAGGTVSGGAGADEFALVTALDSTNTAGHEQVFLTQADGMNPIGEYVWTSGLWIQTG